MLLATASKTSAQKHFHTECNGATIAYNTGNVTHFSVLANCPYMVADTSQFPSPIRAAINNYLLKRAGAAFYKRLHYYSCYTINANTDYGCLDGARFAIQYYFDVQDTMRYYISLVMDLNGNLLSRHFLPDVKTNPNFANIISLCDAYKIADADTFKIDKKVLSLEYSETRNAFVWVAATDKEDKYSSATKPPYLTLNAQTGAVVRRVKSRMNFIRDYGE